MIIPVVSELDTGEQNLLSELVEVWNHKLFRNELRSTYYDTKNVLRDMGISLPPQLERAEGMLGWPAKAVHALAERCNFDGFVIPGGAQDPFELGPLLDRNAFDIELPQGITSSMVHSLSFLTVTKGDVEAGEPDVQMLLRSAKFASALWDRRRRCLKAALAITDTDQGGSVSEFVLYLPDSIVAARKSGARWAVDRKPNPLGEVPVYPLVYRPELDRPFGHSRISRPVMGLTDAAVRTFVRAEVGAEFYASPQRYVLGAEEASFDGNDARWRAITTRLLGIGRDEDGNLPEVGQFSQLTMQPHTEQLRSIASLFCGETGLSLNSLGIVQDNPSSAEAIYAAKEDLIISAQSATRVFGAALKRAAIAAVRIRDGVEASDELLSLQAKWRNPATPSVVSAAQAVAQQVASIPWLAETEVVLEQLGFDQPTITRLLADKKRAQAQQKANSVAQQHLAAVPERGQSAAADVGADSGDQPAGR